jgi:hypothetical protein
MVQFVGCWLITIIKLKESKMIDILLAIAAVYILWRFMQETESEEDIAHKTIVRWTEHDKRNY